MANEVEIKFRVADLEALNRKLTDLGFRLVNARTHEMNTLYDRVGKPLRRRGEVLRIRRYGDTWTLTHKSKGKESKAERHKRRIEIETTVADGEKLHAVFAAIGFSPSFRYEKYRSEWSLGPGHVVVDETPIGNLAEIEGPAEWIDSVAVKLGLTPKDYIKDSYATLFENWKKQTKSKAAEMTFAAVK